MRITSLVALELMVEAPRALVCLRPAENGGSLAVLLFIEPSPAEDFRRESVWMAADFLQKQPARNAMCRVAPRHRLLCTLWDASVSSRAGAGSELSLR